MIFFSEQSLYFQVKLEEILGKRSAIAELTGHKTNLINLNYLYAKFIQVHNCCCCCCRLPSNHCRNWAWVVEEILAYGNRLRSTHCREFHYLKQCRPAYFIRTTQLLPPGHEWVIIFIIWRCY